jgi:signal transduction histidine kinase
MDGVWLADGVGELVTNACEASTTAIRVRSWREELTQPAVDADVPIEAGSWVVLEVADDGPGFASEVLLNAADPFVTTKNGLRGAGFGLALARSAAWHAGGQLVIDSPAHRRGARVRMWLPTTPAHRSAP